MSEQTIVREVAQSEAAKQSRVAVRTARMSARKRGYIYQGESFKFDLAGDNGVVRTTIRHGDVVFLSDADAKVLRRLGRRIAVSESDVERNEIGAPAGDLVADVETVEKAVMEDDYTAAAKLARMLNLDLADKMKPTVFTALLGWLDTQKG